MTLSLPLDGIKQFDQFFNYQMEKVNPTIILMVLYDPPPPEWLRGLRKLDDLPRYAKSLDTIHVIRHALVPQRQIALQAKWIVENCSGAWKMTSKGFHFETYLDSAYFRLRFD